MEGFRLWRKWDGSRTNKDTTHTLGTISICPIFNFCTVWHGVVLRGGAEPTWTIRDSSLVFARGDGGPFHALDAYAVLWTCLSFVYSLSLLVACLGGASRGCTESF